MKYILAGTHQEYRRYLHENNVSPLGHRFIDHADRLIGITNPEVIRYGTWFNRQDLPDVLTSIQMRTLKA